VATFPRIRPFGEAALLVELGEVVDLRLNARVHALAEAIIALGDRDPALDRIGRPVPGYASVLVPFDPLATDRDALAAELRRLAAAALTGRHREPPARPALEIPVRYGGDDGPDLEAVAVATGLSPDEVVGRHAAVPYTVFMLGFVPGFAYLGPLDRALELPRRNAPRLRVPAGSVAVAGRQTAVYPLETPGGWHLIGRTEVRLWDVDADPPARLRPGDRVLFRPT
jgi:KipI family sensor histidine kinase inhibitor